MCFPCLTCPLDFYVRGNPAASRPRPAAAAALRRGTPCAGRERHAARGRCHAAPPLLTAARPAPQGRAAPRRLAAGRRGYAAGAARASPLVAALPLGPRPAVKPAAVSGQSFSHRLAFLAPSPRGGGGWGWGDEAPEASPPHPGPPPPGGREKNHGAFV